MNTSAEELIVVTTQLPLSIKEQLEARAEAEHRSMAATLRLLVERYLSDPQPKSD